MNKHKRALAKAGLALCKAMCDSNPPDKVIADGHTSVDLLRTWRNRVWDKYGPDELQAMETEIDLNLPCDE